MAGYEEMAAELAARQQAERLHRLEVARASLADARTGVAVAAGALGAAIYTKGKIAVITGPTIMEDETARREQLAEAHARADLLAKARDQEAMASELREMSDRNAAEARGQKRELDRLRRQAEQSDETRRRSEQLKLDIARNKRSVADYNERASRLEAQVEATRADMARPPLNQRPGVGVNKVNVGATAAATGAGLGIGGTAVNFYKAHARESEARAELERAQRALGQAPSSSGLIDDIVFTPLSGARVDFDGGDGQPSGVVRQSMDHAALQALHVAEERGRELDAQLVKARRALSAIDPGRGALLPGQHPADP